MDAQAAIDAYKYPPTHSYDVASLTPRGPLAERVDRILEMCPGFFEARRFLDVGCSKGFFSLVAAKAGGFVLAVDPDAAALGTWASVTPMNVERVLGTFAQIDAETYGRFDMIWIGNGHHYLYREDPEWITRLEALAETGGRVVIEGPISAKACRDLAGFGATQDEETFLARMSRSFVLEARSSSPSYTPGRAIWAFKTL